MFEIKKRDGQARLGVFTTKHGKVKTPALLPVINPNMSRLFPEEMKEKFGAQMVITNSYIIRKYEKHRVLALEKGVHELLKTDMPIMTDSGTFQTYVYGDDVKIDHKGIVEFQRDIGSDVGTMLDLFTTPDMGYTKAKADIRENLSRGADSVPLKGEMKLAGTIQGGIFPELRQWCAEEMSKQAFDFFPLGGVVPLMEGYRYGKLMEVILAAKKGLSPTRPVHLFGGGHPMVFAFAALAGVDFFDSSSYIKYAKDDRLIFPDSSRRLSEIEELACCCPVCSKHTVPELRKMEKEERTSLLAQHNLGVMFQEIRAVRDAIAGEFLFELVEQRCRSHPSLVEVLNVLEKAQSDMEKAVAVSRRTALFELSEFSMKRPILVRYQQRLRSRWQPFGPFYTLLDDMDSRIRKPYAIGHAGFIHRYLKTHLDDEEASSPVLAMVNSRLGYVPLELSEIYPIAQSVTHSVPFPEGQTPFQEDRKALVEEKGISFVELGEKAPKDLPGKLKRLWEKSYHKSLGIDLRAFQDVFDDFRSLRLKGSTTPFFDIQLLTAVLDYQLGRGAFEAIFLNRPPKDPFPKYGFQRFTTEELEDADISFVKSKNTGKIRNVHGGGEHLLSMHAFDGFFLLKRVAAWRLNQHLSGRHRVKVDPDSAQFNLKGKSVFARFVLEADPDIRPGDEVVVVDPEGKTVAVGSALLTAEEMKAFEVGMAVKVSQGLGKKDKKK